jgi:hypothetical protein
VFEPHSFIKIFGNITLLNYTSLKKIIPTIGAGVLKKVERMFGVCSSTFIVLTPNGLANYPPDLRQESELLLIHPRKR